MTVDRHVERHLICQGLILLDVLFAEAILEHTVFPPFRGRPAGDYRGFVDILQCNAQCSSMATFDMKNATSS